MSYKALLGLFCTAVVFSAAYVSTVSLAQTASSAKPTADLPPGPMQAKATAACTECHEARIILQQRLSKPAWTREVDKMTKWGALVGVTDREALIEYFSANFGVDQAQYQPPRTSSQKKGAVKLK
jgi:hypothetical protein